MIKLSDLGITRDESSSWQNIAAIPEPKGKIMKKTWFEIQHRKLYWRGLMMDEAVEELRRLIAERWEAAKARGEIQELMESEGLTHFQAVLILSKRWGLPSYREDVREFLV